MNVVVRPLDNPWIDRLIHRRRELSGNRSISKRDIARPILKALAANQAVGILIDHNWTADTGVFVDFFGLPACTGRRLCETRGAQRSCRDSGVRALVGKGTAIRPAFLSARPDYRRCRTRYGGAASRVRKNRARASRPSGSGFTAAGRHARPANRLCTDSLPGESPSRSILQT